MELPREYEPAAAERRGTETWERGGLFTADPASGRPPFCMVIPPPNVTGNLHIGHVLVYTLHDVIARWERMRGRDVLWLPGTDHAGIATQMVVERELAREGQTRQQLGRAEFERRVWRWKAHYGGRITAALRDLGSSVDWTRERFTLDPRLSHAVRTVFVELYRAGLIYRDRFIVHWCPRCQTALSDLESVARPVAGQLYVISYPGAEGKGSGVQVATTRPETLLGDTAVAVHPDDERYRAFVGGQVDVPLTGRKVPVVADAMVDREFGTGAVKITPSHDANDFAVARRLGLPELEVIDATGHMTAAAAAYAGLDRFAARERVVADLRTQGLLVEVRPHEHAVGHCQRCGTLVEPRVSLQWFVRIAPLAAPAIEAVEQGRVRFVPEAWAKTYFEWMRNIHDWCISRQLWWGHRIPAWYCEACHETHVAHEAPQRCTGCGGTRLTQDEDVLDTWFSSALWPFSTLGWPEETPDLARYYPTSLLITGHDIIFFWVARMIMFGLRFRGDVPFREVYIHGLVRDASGQKMSKSKGNTVDPEELHSKYGTDAVRLTMAMLAAPGNDIPLAPERMAGYRAFANKLWNASRFVLLKLDPELPVERRAPLALADRWILSRLARTTANVDAALAERRFDRAADAVYHFVWHEFCDWYIELCKPDLPPAIQPADVPRAAGGDLRPSLVPPERGATVRAVLLEVLSGLLRLLHPFMPFVTEELWQRLPARTSALAVAPWPTVDPQALDPGAETEMTRLQELVVAVRQLRAEAGLEPGAPIRVLVQARGEIARSIAAEERLLKALLRAQATETVERIPAELHAARSVVRDLPIAVPLAGLVDVDAARTRLLRALERVDEELARAGRKLADPAFRERAPAAIVETERQRQGELAARRERLAHDLGLLPRAPSP